MTTAVVPQVTDRLVDYTLTFAGGRIPEAARDAARKLLLDYLGVALGGYRFGDSTPSAVAGVQSLLSGADGECTVVGEWAGYPAHFAALLNATYAHSMDYDDTHMGSVIHVGTPLLSTLLALGEQADVSGHAFLTAAIIGYDVIGKTGKAHGEGVHRRGFHATATTGIFGATAAGARLLGLGREELLNALGINISQAAGSLAFLENGAWTKRLQVGLAAHNAVYALAFARQGFRGATSPLEGRFGYYHLYSQDACDLDQAVAGLGEDFEVLNTGVKPYPACRYTHSVIDGVLGLVRKDALASRDIKAVDVYLTPVGNSVIGDPAEAKRLPVGVVDGQFSAYFTTAVTALDGRFNWQSYQRLQDPEVRDLMQRVTVHTDSDLPRFGTRVVATTSNGHRLSIDVPFPKGEPENPLDWPELEAKFRDLAEGALGREKTERVVQQVREVDRLERLTDLTRTLRP